jgi:hypothetical protein
MGIVSVFALHEGGHYLGIKSLFLLNPPQKCYHPIRDSLLRLTPTANLLAVIKEEGRV